MINWVFFWFDFWTQHFLLTVFALLKCISVFRQLTQLHEFLKNVLLKRIEVKENIYLLNLSQKYNSLNTYCNCLWSLYSNDRWVVLFFCLLCIKDQREVFYSKVKMKVVSLLYAQLSNKIFIYLKLNNCFFNEIVLAYSYLHLFMKCK